MQRGAIGNGRSGGRATLLVMLGLIVSVALAACGGSDGTTASSSTSAGGGSEGDKKIFLEMPFPCALNEVISEVCEGAEAAGEKLPAGYELEVKTGKDIADNVAFNNLIQTSLELDPVGLAVFPGGPAAQSPVLNDACSQGVALVAFSDVEGVDCLSAVVGADNVALGANVGEWLVDNPPASKEVAIVTQAPGQFASTDERVEGFEDTVKEAGFDVVATGITDLALDKTRTQVSNIVTAHPDLGAVYSANGPIGEGTSQALRGNDEIDQLTLDWVPSYAPKIEDGTLDAVGDPSAFEGGELAIENLVKVIEGKTIPPEVHTKIVVVDKENVEQE